MPYNTRRKSLSLPSLGIHVPVTHAARAAAAAAVAAAATKSTTPNTVASPVSASTSSTSSSNTSSSSAQQRQLIRVSDSTTNMAPPATTPFSSASPKRTSSASDAQQPSSKRAKRSHGDAPSSTTKSAAVATPPQSPRRQASVEMDSSDDVEEVEIDMDEVNDDIVEAVIIQLKSTGNRPHLIKELSAILMQQLKSVQQSANPCAIISSRLASYMKRACWSASKNCPLTKELENIHPRRTYYFLTTCPHLPLPDASSVHFIVPRTSIVTPPLSSAASGSEAAEEERRRELSPSPEVDLSSPEFDDLDDDIPMPGTPVAHLSHRYPRYSRFSRYHHGHHRSSGSYSSRNHRGASPPLEKDEKEFTQTAEGLQKQKHAGSRFLLSPAAIAAQAAPPSAAAAHAHNNGMFLDDAAGREETLLFGSEMLTSTTSSTRHIEHFTLMTSPAMRPMFSLGPKRDHEADSWAKLDSMVNDWDRCPENIELDELDGLLDEF